MFTIDNTTIHANLNRCIIKDTMRNQDLIPRFLKVIKDTKEYATFKERKLSYNLSVIFDKTAKDNDNRWDSIEVTKFLCELKDILDSYCPDDCYFGTHINNGTAYGYWYFDPDDYEIK